MVTKQQLRKVLGDNYSRTSFYGRWCNIKDRCTNPKNKQYKDYGGRGIKLCNEWQTFECFFEDNYEEYLLASRGCKDIQIDRIDNNKGYSKDNTRWVPRSFNAQNKRKRTGTYSRFQGVTWHKKNKRWMCNFMFNRKRIYLGCFDDEEDAAIMYNVGARMFFGNNAQINRV